MQYNRTERSAIYRRTKHGVLLLIMAVTASGTDATQAKTKSTTSINQKQRHIVTRIALRASTVDTSLNNWISCDEPALPACLRVFDDREAIFSLKIFRLLESSKVFITLNILWQRVYALQIISEILRAETHTLKSVCYNSGANGRSCCCYTEWVKKSEARLMTTIMSNLNRLIFFHRKIPLLICSQMDIKNPTAPCICCYTTLWNINVSKTNH